MGVRVVEQLRSTCGELIKRTLRPSLRLCVSRSYLDSARFNVMYSFGILGVLKIWGDADLGEPWNQLSEVKVS